MEISPLWFSEDSCSLCDQMNSGAGGIYMKNEGRLCRIKNVTVEREPLSATLNNTLSHCQIKVKANLFPLERQTSSNLASMMNDHWRDSNTSRIKLFFTMFLPLREKYFCKTAQLLEKRDSYSYSSKSHSKITGRKMLKKTIMWLLLISNVYAFMFVFACSLRGWKFLKIPKGSGAPVLTGIW